MALHPGLLPPPATTASLRFSTAWAQPARRAPGGGRGGRRAAKLLVSGALATGILALALPRVAGAQWVDIAHALASLSVAHLALLAVVWLAGLWVHTPALTAALPGLSHRRALLLNLTGSFVSNLLPLGGAAGTVANWRMARSWGFASPAFARWALLTNLCDTALKLALPGVAFLWLAAAGVEAGGAVNTAAYVGLGLLTGIVVALWLLARDDRAVTFLGRWADRLCARVRVLRPPEQGYAVRAAAFRRDSAALVAAGWWRMAFGKIAYAVLQAGLLWLSLRVLGELVNPSVVLAAFAVERILSMVVITPGATGVVEVGMTGVLVALGVDPTMSAAGVLLYRAFTFGMEIPVGGLSMLAWSLTRRPLAA
ncbi:lysylphosphatidylglycerol synthase transmembrane domain-containing protein [Pedococcus sp. KACC 23699]|uniref:Lysylphosphatidylglycerol synthase transmembrane domain-containing protein n=1 Tax=Pedococcus sp. KACC 23699 TaxID=3149228 RepID=A0AAU7JXK7_9MICO